MFWNELVVWNWHGIVGAVFEKDTIEPLQTTFAGGIIRGVRVQPKDDGVGLNATHVAAFLEPDPFDAKVFHLVDPGIHLDDDETLGLCRVQEGNKNVGVGGAEEHMSQ